MTRTTDIHRQFNTAFKQELNCVAALAQARLDAARLLADFFASAGEATKEQLAAVRVAIQFTARAFRPLESLRKLIEKDEAHDDTTDTNPPRAARTPQHNKARCKSRPRATPPRHDHPGAPTFNLTTSSVLNSDALLC